MIKAAFRARCAPSPGDAVAAATAALRAGSAAAAARTARSRERALRFLKYARRAGFRQGYAQGAAAAQDELARIAQGVRHEYATLLEAAQRDYRRLAMAACERLIGKSDPDTILPWLDKALQLARTARPITVSVKPRYRTATTRHLESQSAGVAIVEAPQDQEEDFLILTEQGEIGFAWTSALQDALGPEAR